MTSLKSVRKRRQQLNARDVKGLVEFCFYPLEEKNSQQIVFSVYFKVQTVFTPISRPDKHVELLKIYFKLLIKKLRISHLVA